MHQVTIDPAVGGWVVTYEGEHGPTSAVAETKEKALLKLGVVLGKRDILPSERSVNELEVHRTWERAPQITEEQLAGLGEGGIVRSRASGEAYIIVRSGGPKDKAAVRCIGISNPPE